MNGRKKKKKKRRKAMRSEVDRNTQLEDLLIMRGPVISRRQKMEIKSDRPESARIPGRLKLVTYWPLIYSHLMLLFQLNYIDNQIVSKNGLINSTSSIERSSGGDQLGENNYNQMKPNVIMNTFPPQRTFDQAVKEDEEEEKNVDEQYSSVSKAANYTYLMHLNDDPELKHWTGIQVRRANSGNPPQIREQSETVRSNNDKLVESIRQKMHSFGNAQLMRNLIINHRDAKYYPSHRKPAKLVNNRISIDVGHLSQALANPAPIKQQVYLPNGPPPYRPSSLALSVASNGALEKFKQTLVFKRMYKSKLYYIFLDVLRELTSLANRMSQAKMSFTSSKLQTLQTILNKFAWKGGDSLKLRWPIIMLNPKFLREILSNPTFLVMLFHAVEVAYMSMPVNFWLKPLVKLVAQPSPEKEDQIWWRRKRLYDTLNGIGASELEPNLKTIHFRYPGEQTPVAIPTLANLVRQYLGRPAPNAAHYSQPVAGKQRLPQVQQEFYADNLEQQEQQQEQLTYPPPLLGMANEGHNHVQQSSGTTLVDNESLDWQNGCENDPSCAPAINMMTIRQPDEAKPEAAQYPDLTNYHDQDWLTHLPSQDELMSAGEFETLDPQVRERVIKEAKRGLDESKWTNELIKQHTDYIESVASQRANEEPQLAPIFHRFGKQDHSLSEQNQAHKLRDQLKPKSKGAYFYKDEVDDNLTESNDEQSSQR